ncbi:MAG: motility associated factor glycosyltransferase family protein [Candidatus Glassbacteria bacterium]|nr:motility associated factor glycosyltransferase family protein [Candidatus Glassbacteria bacterium]
MDIFKHNIQALAGVDPHLAERLLRSETAAAEIIGTRAGVPSVRLKNAGGRPFTLHSTVDPLSEAERIVDSQYQAGVNTCLVYGFGLGYHLEVLARRLPPNAWVLVVEPQITIFRLALSVRDLSHLFRNPRIFWAVGEDADQVPAHFGEVFRVISLEGFSIIAHNPSVRLCGEYFDLLDKLCRRWIVAVGGNFLTNVQAVRNYLSNTLENIISVVEHPPVTKLFGRFHKVPGLVVAAGPSLDRNLDLLRVMERSAVIICVDTSLGPLYRAGVRPHLVLAGDASEYNFKHLEGMGETGAALVAEPMTHPGIVSEFKGDKFIMSFNEALMRRLSEFMGDFGVVKAWGSISTGAFDLARRLGCDPIVFVGQDLSFPGARYYAHGTYQEQRWLRDLSHPATLDEVHRGRMVNENNQEAEDIFGRPVRTSKVLEAYRQYLDREISQTRARVINASEGGVGFQGVENMPLEEVLWRFARKQRPIRKIIHSTRARRPGKEISHLFHFLKETSDELEKMCRHCNEGFELARSIHQQESSDLKADFDKIEKAYNKLYRQRETLEFVENANQGGLLAFQRGTEKLKGRELDREAILEAVKIYGAFFISFYQTALFLKKRFERAAVAVGLECHHGTEEDRRRVAGRVLQAS